MKFIFATYFLAASVSASPTNLSCKSHLVMGAAAFAVSTGLTLAPAQSASEPHSIFSPTLLHSTYKVWHPLAKPGANTPTESAAGTFTDEAYAQGEIGNAELNQQSADVQGELRLMQPKQQNALPVDLRVIALARSEEVWSAHTQATRDHLEELRKELAGIDPTGPTPQPTTTLPSKANEAGTPAKNLTAERDLTLALLTEQKVIADRAKIRLADLQTANNQIHSQSFWCVHIRWGCAAPPAFNPDDLAKATTAQKESSAALKRLQGQLKGTQLLLNQVPPVKAHASQVPALPTVHETSGTYQGARREQLHAEIKKLEEELESFNGFVLAKIPDVRCRHPLLYLATPNTQGAVNPLLGKDLDTEMAPSSEVELRACVNPRSRVTGAYIFRTGHEIYHSEIARTRRGQIDQIVIEDEKHQVVEDHRWFFNRDGSFRYALTFRTAQGDFQSIYTDVPR